MPLTENQINDYKKTIERQFFRGINFDNILNLLENNNFTTFAEIVKNDLQIQEGYNKPKNYIKNLNEEDIPQVKELFYIVFDDIKKYISIAKDLTTVKKSFFSLLQSLKIFFDNDYNSVSCAIEINIMQDYTNKDDRLEKGYVVEKEEELMSHYNYFKSFGTLPVNIRSKEFYKHNLALLEANVNLALRYLKNNKDPIEALHSFEIVDLSELCKDYSGNYIYKKDIPSDTKIFFNAPVIIEGNIGENAVIMAEGGTEIKGKIGKNTVIDAKIDKTILKRDTIFDGTVYKFGSMQYLLTPSKKYSLDLDGRKAQQVGKLETISKTKITDLIPKSQLSWLKYITPDTSIEGIPGLDTIKETYTQKLPVIERSYINGEDFIKDKVTIFLTLTGILLHEEKRSDVTYITNGNVLVDAPKKEVVVTKPVASNENNVTATQSAPLKTIAPKESYTQLVPVKKQGIYTPTQTDMNGNLYYDIDVPENAKLSFDKPVLFLGNIGDRAKIKINGGTQILGNVGDQVEITANIDKTTLNPYVIYDGVNPTKVSELWKNNWKNINPSKIGTVTISTQNARSNFSKKELELIKKMNATGSGIKISGAAFDNLEEGYWFYEKGKFKVVTETSTYEGKLFETFTGITILGKVSPTAELNTNGTHDYKQEKQAKIISSEESSKPIYLNERPLSLREKKVLDDLLNGSIKPSDLNGRFERVVQEYDKLLQQQTNSNCNSRFV